MSTITTSTKKHIVFMALLTIVIFVMIGMIAGGLIESNPEYLWIPAVMFVAGIGVLALHWQVFAENLRADAEVWEDEEGEEDC